ncbi:MAG: phenylacetate--CoA ligase family protein [Acidobacteria bacterium]|nr:phenylacetate--CoA ligase family protein [Acidobacteriota bacterium]
MNTKCDPVEITPLENWMSQRLRITGRPLPSLVQRYQIARLRETIGYVKAHSRFYREHLRGMDPEAIQGIGDLAKLPLIGSGILADRPRDLFCVAPCDVSRIVTLSSSGTTGKPKRVAFTPEDQELIIDFFHHGMMTLARPCDRVLIFLPGRTEGSVGDLLTKALRRFDCEGIVFGPISDYPRAMKTLSNVAPDCAVGIPSQLLALSRYVRKRIKLRSVLLTTDYVPEAVVESLGVAWGCRVYNHYGMTEMGLGGAVECSAREGYHLREADLLFEIVDPAGRQVKDGEYGEVVFSTLTRKGMPLIRYRTGDVSRFLPGPCRCGSVLRRMERVSGRLEEPVRLWDGSTLSITRLDEILFRNPSIAAYRAELHRGEGCDSLILTATPVGEKFDADPVISQLCRQPHLGDLVRQGRLRIEVRSGDPAFTTGTAKRSITVSRRAGSSPLN